MNCIFLCVRINMCAVGGNLWSNELETLINVKWQRRHTENNFILSVCIRFEKQLLIIHKIYSIWVEQCDKISHEQFSVYVNSELNNQHIVVWWAYNSKQFHLWISILYIFANICPWPQIKIWLWYVTLHHTGWIVGILRLSCRICSSLVSYAQLVHCWPCHCVFFWNFILLKLLSLSFCVVGIHVNCDAFKFNKSNCAIVPFAHCITYITRQPA